MSLVDHQTNKGTFFSEWAAAWDGFWFTPRDQTMLGLIRILVGCLVFYTHAVWTLELSTFFGADGLLPVEYRELLFGNSFAWSHLGWFQSPTSLMVVHWIGLAVIALFTIGVWARWTGLLTALLVISYANRATGALFGLDQINAFLCLYLTVGNSGAALSLDAWRKRRSKRMNDSEQSSWLESTEPPDTSTNLAIRLIQIHMCVVYLFAAIGKLQGETWFTGEAIWGALASHEYQTLDMTWLSGHLWLVAIITLGALAWELTYAALIWPRLTRPIMLVIAIPIHLGIGICMGMLEFGLIMLIGNLAFFELLWLRRLARIRK